MQINYLLLPYSLMLIVSLNYVNSSVNSNMIPGLAKRGRKSIAADCLSPLVGQFNCSEPIIDSTTQQPVNCDKTNKAKINCSLGEGFYCKGYPDKNVTTFSMEIDCLYTNGYHFETALLLSIFLGLF